TCLQRQAKSELNNIERGGHGAAQRPESEKKVVGCVQGIPFKKAGGHGGTVCQVASGVVALDYALCDAARTRPAESLLVHLAAALGARRVALPRRDGS